MANSAESETPPPYAAASDPSSRSTTRQQARRLDTQEQQLERFVEEMGGNMATEIDASEPNSDASPPEDEDTSGTVGHHLIFVVHGMGQRKPKFLQNIKSLGDLCETLQQRDSSAGRKDSFHFVAIDWHTKLHALPSVDARMSLVNLSTVPFFRQLNNEYLADTLYYFTPYHAERIAEIVVEEVHAQLAACRKKYKNIRSLSFFGFSLGSVIMYDILANQQPHPDKAGKENTKFMGDISFPKLNFTPHCLFMVGSPVSAVMVMRGMSFSNYTVPSHIRVFNCYNPYDPIAYRIEPLMLEGSGEHVEGPVMIERVSQSSSSAVSTTISYTSAFGSIFTNTLYSTSISTIFSTIRSKIVSENGSPETASLKQSGQSVVEELDLASTPSSTKRKREKPLRYDYQLQVNLFENINNEYLNGIGAHFSYWSSLDLVNFMMTNLRSISSPSSP